MLPAGHEKLQGLGAQKHCEPQVQAVRISETGKVGRIFRRIVDSRRPRFFLALTVRILGSIHQLPRTSLFNPVLAQGRTSCVIFHFLRRTSTGHGLSSPHNVETGLQALEASGTISHTCAFCGNTPDQWNAPAARIELGLASRPSSPPRGIPFAPHNTARGT